jgi:hypothetical protein
MRYSLISDPDTGEIITIDNPRAWPATNELALNVLDQERLWGISPILRDRILVAKATGLWRLERDPITEYRLVVVSRSVGSRFPDTWAEKKNMLYFVGQDKDGYPEVFKTDMVDVSLVDTDGGIEPTLRGLQQPNQVFRSQIFTSKTDFDAGVGSTFTKTDGGQLAVGGLDVDSAIVAALVSGSNIDLETNPGKVCVLGHPVWDEDYRMDLMPEEQTVTWVKAWRGSGHTESPFRAGIVDGQMTLISGGLSPAACFYFYKSDVLDPTKDNLMRIKVDSTGSSNPADGVNFGLWNGRYAAAFSFGGTLLADAGSGILVNTAAGPIVFTLLLKANGTYKVWANRVLVITGTPITTTINRVQWGQGGAQITGDVILINPSVSVKIDSVSWIAGFKGDDLSNQAGKISPVALPDTLPDSGNIVVLNDHTRAPAALGKLWETNVLFPIASCVVTAGSLTVNLDSGTNMEKFFVGQVLDVRETATGLLVTNGAGQAIESIDKTDHTITFTNAVGVVTTTASHSVYRNPGTAATESWTSTSSDFTAGNDPAGYLATTLGAAPASQVRQYQRLRLTLSERDDTQCPVVDELYSGMLWTSPPISNGTQISAWRTFLDTIVVPEGTSQTLQIRRATTIGEPIESDWGSWVTVADGNNIGTVLSDTSSLPTSRWTQLKVEQSVSSVGLIPYVDTLVVQWGEGSVKNLPIRAVVHKKRYFVCAARSGASGNDIVIVCDRNDQWTKFFGWALNGFTHFRSQFYGMDGGDAYVSQLDLPNVFDDDGVAIDGFLVTREEAMDAGHLRKNCRFSYLHWDRTLGAYTLASSYKMTGDTDFSTPKTFTFGTEGLDLRHNFPMGTVGRRIQRKYENNVVGEDLRLMGETFYYDVRPAQPV